MKRSQNMPSARYANRTQNTLRMNPGVSNKVATQFYPSIFESRDFKPKLIRGFVIVSF
jgi:hypothetical protein